MSPSIESEGVWDASRQCFVGKKKAIRPDGLYWVWEPGKPRGNGWRIYEWCWKNWYTLDGTGKSGKYSEEAFVNSKMVVGHIIEVPPEPVSRGED